MILEITGISLSESPRTRRPSGHIMTLCPLFCADADIVVVVVVVVVVVDVDDDEDEDGLEGVEVEEEEMVVVHYK